MEAIAAAGISRVVKISGLGSTPDCVISMGRDHYSIERHMDALGLQATAVRPSLMMHNLLGEADSAIRQGRLPSAAGEHRISWVHARDVAAVAATALSEPGHDGKAYDVTGPDALTYRDLAQTFSQVLGYPVTYEPISDEAYAQDLLDAGYGPWAVEHLVAMYRDAVRTGYFDVVTDTVMSVTGTPATPFAQWVGENAELFSPQVVT
jgi:uncharacterized protein YbjT (DUF2867 family)